MALVFYLSLFILSGGLIYFHKFSKFKYLKYSALALLVLFLLSYMQHYPLIRDTVRLTNPLLSPNKAVNGWALLIFWTTIVNILILFFKPFHQIKIINHLVAYVVTPLSLCLLCSWPLYAKSIIGPDPLSGFSWWNILLLLQTVLHFSQLGAYWLQNHRLYQIKKKEILTLCLVAMGMILFAMPTFAPAALFGYGLKTKGIDLKFGHRVFLYASVILPFILYFLFRKKDQPTKRLAMLYISYATMISYLVIYPFTVLKSPNTWPFHLCNTAMFIIPLSITFNWKRIFYFTFFINIFGAFVANLAPNYSFTHILEPGMISYWLNHIMVFFMPFLLIELGIFARPKRKQFIYSQSAFAVYFALALIFNAWFSNYGHADYFFLNSNFIVGKVGFSAYKLRLFIVSFRINDLTFTFYPAYQALFFVTYIFLSLGAWFVYETFYQVIDYYGGLNMKKAALKTETEQFLSEPSPASPGDGKVQIIDFGKKYAGSDRYAVRHLNLEINPGEVFAFLGHNGAGKSTLIKSLVGIQPLTEGKIYINGYNIAHQSVPAKQQMGFVPDHYALYERLTGREYVNYVADIYNVPKAERNRRLEHYTKIFELQAAIDAQIKTYSHGMKQKVAIIAALIHEPKVWILDEPLTGLDPTSVYQVKQTIKEYAERGNCVFFSSHLLDFVATICHRFAIIKMGTILAVEEIGTLEKGGKSLEEYYIEVTKLEPGK